MTKIPHSFLIAHGSANPDRGSRLRFMPTALVLALSGALAMPGMALAADWSGTVSNDWFAPGNWSTGVPMAGDDVLIEMGPGPNISGAGANGVAQNLTVGNTGSGALVISNGGMLGNQLGIIGNAAGFSGAVTVDGPGSIWTNNMQLGVGNFGSGTLAVTNGATVKNTTGYLGVSLGGIGTATIDGKDSRWINSADMIIGNSGTGKLSVTGGGTVESAGGYLGGDPDGVGTVIVNGKGSSWANSGDLAVGLFGKGTLAITNGGLMSNVDGWIGADSAAAGSVTVDGANSTWANGGGLVVANDGIGTLTIANGGTVKAANMVRIAVGASSTGVLNIGGANGAAAAAPGMLVAPAGVQFGAGFGTLNFNHTDTSGNYAFDAPLGGVGIINQNAGWTNLTGDSSGFAGDVLVSGGRLAVNGSLANAIVQVNKGGTLGGNGFVGGIKAQAGGTVAPGNSIGTLNVMGNVSQAAGSIYEVELNTAGQSDLIKATGAATIEAGALLKPVNYGLTRLVLGKRYTVLQADGGVTGQYSLLGGSTFVDFAAAYDATHAYLDVTKARAFAEAGLTPNQKAAGAGIESLTGGAVYGTILMSPTDQAARTAFDQLSGEVHASARSVQLQDSHFMRDASLERLRAMDSERMANDGGADPEEGKPARLLPSVRDLAYWARAMGSWGHINSDGNAASVKRDTSGFLMGADTRFGEEGRFGLMGGYSRSSFDVTDRNSSGSSENYHFGAYAGSRWGDLALRTGVDYSWHDVSTSRSVAFPGFTDSLKADYKASTTQAFAELGYRIKTERAELEPFANLALVNVASDGFTERGGAAALASAGNSSGVTFSTVGLRASTNFDMNNGTSVTARGSIGWRNASGDVTPTTSMAFAGGSPFAVAGAPIAKSAAVIEAGLDFKLTNAATLGISYGGQFGSGLKDHSARIHLNVSF